MQPHLKQYWKIPPKASAAYVACMEDVLEVYARPYDPLRPVVCMDETNKQLIGKVREPLPVEPGKPARIEHEYVRNGVAQVFLEVELLSGQRQCRGRRAARAAGLGAVDRRHAGDTLPAGRAGRIGHG